MRRRDLCTALAISAGLPLGRVAAETRIYRVGVLETVTTTSEATSREALRRGLQEQGYLGGQNLAFEYRSAGTSGACLAASMSCLAGVPTYWLQLGRRHPAQQPPQRL